jgi:hypothetical protein
MEKGGIHGVDDVERMVLVFFAILVFSQNNTSIPMTKIPITT